MDSDGQPSIHIESRVSSLRNRSFSVR